MTSPVLEVASLSKTFGGEAALVDAHLTLAPGPYVHEFFYGGALIVSVAFASVGVRRPRNRRAESG